MRSPRVSRAGKLRVTPTNAVVHAQPDGRAIQETARTLGVDYLLTGTIQLISDSTRVTVQLVSAADNGSVWAEHYDLPHANLLILEDDISEKVAGALRVPVTPAERAQLAHRYTSNPLAYESYLRGRAELLRYTQEGTLTAIKSFDAAAQLDPRYALAHAGLASASAQMHLRFAADDEVALWSARAQREAILALDLDPDLAEVHEALAAVYGQTDFDWPRTISESRETLALNPSLPLPHYYLARAFYHYGLLEMIEGEVRAGLDIDPVNRLEAYRLRGTAALVSGRFQEALHWLGEARKLSAPEVTVWYYAQALYYAGDRHGAESLLQGLHGGAQASQRARATLASFLAADGAKQQAEALIGQTLAIAYMDHHVAYSLGAAYAQLGQPGQAMAWLRKAADSGFPCYPWYAGDSLLQPIHGDPAFGRLLSDLEDQLQLARTRYR
jgi:tetratricopeptide (TPR) repeat protein